METVQTLQGHAGTIHQLAFSADEKLLASVSLDRTVRIWDWQAGQELWSELAHETSSTSVAFSPDGRTIATAGEDATLRFWRWEVGRLALELPLDHSSTSDIQYSLDGQQVLVVHPHDGIEIFDASPLAAPLQEASPASF